MEKTNICIVGLGYVGLPLAIEFAKKYPVVGFDISVNRVDELKNGIDRTLEVSNIELSKTNLVFTADSNEIKPCNHYIITVPTPVDSANRPDFSPLISASTMIGRVLKAGDIVIYESTVYPGCTEEVCVPILEKFSGLVFNVDFFCGYSPERINPGDKVNTLTTIKKITSGSTPKSAKIVNALYASIITAGTWPAASIKVAEAAKVIENSQRDLNIAFVNELSIILERMGVDTLDVLEAAGSKWNFLPFRPGMVGGHCISVDPYYLTHKAELLGYTPQVILAGRRINDNMAKHSAECLVKRMIQNGHNISESTVGILGVTFKENCPDIRNSKVFSLINELKSWGLSVVATDPLADPNEVRHEYGVELCDMAEIKAVDSIIVAVGHTEFRNLTAANLSSMCSSSKRPVLGDLKSIYLREQLSDFNIFRL